MTLVRVAGTGRTLLLFILGLAFVHSGAAAWLWNRVEADDVRWRTGPTWGGTLAFLAIYWAGWAAAVTLLRLGRRHGAPGGMSLQSFFASARHLVTSCLLVVIQVLMPAAWLPAALAMLLVATSLDACIVRERPGRAVTHWAWSGAGVALATLLIHPWFVGQPLFVVRLAVVMTLWDWLGDRAGVSHRLMRFVPSLYDVGRGGGSSSSDCTASQARVAR